MHSPGGVLILATAIVVLLAGIAQVIAGAISIGVTLDEPTHVMRLQGLIGEGWYVPPVFLTDIGPSSVPEASPYVYGPAYSLIAHAANVVTGNESTGDVSNYAAAWETRHLVVALIGLLTAAAAGLAVWLLTASRRFAVWGAAALLAFPIWVGMSLFNPKDVPVAAGYTLFTVGLLLALGRGRLVGTTRASAVAVGSLLAVGFYLSAGTRPALWAALLASAATFAVLAWGRMRFAGAPRDRLGAGAVVVGILIGILAMVVSYPAVFSHPFDLLTQSIADSADFSWSGFTLTAGRLVPPFPPWWYLPVWVFASSPVLLLLLSIAGAASPFGVFARVHSRIDRARLREWLARDDVGVVLVAQQALLMSVGSILIGANMYGGLRQHLYVVPALAILAGVGASALWRRVSAGAGIRRGRVAVALLVSAALAVPMIEQAFLLPYNYVYVNPIAGIGGINGRWETDFWEASRREALSLLPPDAQPYCGSLSQSANDDQPAISSCILSPVIAPYLGERQGEPIGSQGSAAQSVWVISSDPLADADPAQCSQADDVTRWLRGEEVLMTHVFLCDSSLAPKPAPLPVLP